MRTIIFQSAIWFLILVIGFSQELLRMHTFLRDDALVNSVCPLSHRSMDVHASYKEQCLSICGNIPSCLSVFFADHFGKCIGCARKYRDGASLLKMKGMIHFKKVSSCDQGWIHFHDSCYFFALDKLVTYREAEEFCEQVDADIVLPNDAAEDKFIVGQLALASGDGSAWIALRGNTTGNTTGRNWYVPFGANDPVIFTNWQSGEPNNPDEHCVETFHMRQPGWNDIRCTSTNVIVCEKYNEN